MDKHQARQMLKQRRAGLSADYMRAASAAIAGKLLALLAAPSPCGTSDASVPSADVRIDTDALSAPGASQRAVMLYRALPGEVNLDALADELRARGVQVVLPKVAGELLEVRCYEGPDSLEKGAFGIMEPVGPLYDGPLDAVVVPGLGFDLAGGRIGFGKGFYDRFLASQQNLHAFSPLPTSQPSHLPSSASSQLPFKIGVCYRQMLLERVPADPHDVPMDMVITE